MNLPVHSSALQLNKTILNPCWYTFIYVDAYNEEEKQAQTGYFFIYLTLLYISLCILWMLKRKYSHEIPSIRAKHSNIPFMQLCDRQSDLECCKIQGTKYVCTLLWCDTEFNSHWHAICVSLVIVVVYYFVKGKRIKQNGQCFKAFE